MMLLLPFTLVAAIRSDISLNCTWSDLRRLADCHGTITSPPTPVTSVDLSNNAMLLFDDMGDVLWASEALLELRADLCGLRSIPRRLLSATSGLRLLSARGNQLSRLEYAAFTSNAELRWLALSGNRLRYLGDSSFSGLRHLRYLDLADNRISVIDRKAFLPLVSLRILLLHGNKLVTFSGSLIQQLPSITRLVLYPGNRFVCDCRLRRIRHWTLLRPPVRGHYNNSGIVCSSPDYLRGRQLMKLLPEMLRYANGVGERDYDVMVGVYTALTLAGMLVSFLTCLLMDRLKQVYVHRRRANRCCSSINQPKISEHPSPKHFEGKSLWSGQSGGVIADFGYIPD